MRKAKTPSKTPTAEEVRLAARLELDRLLADEEPGVFRVRGRSAMPGEFKQRGSLERTFVAALLRASATLTPRFGPVFGVCAATGLDEKTVLAGVIDLSRGARVETVGGGDG